MSSSAIFDAMQAEFVSAFGAAYLDGILYKTSQSFSDDGAITEGQASYPIKVMYDDVTERMRADGYTDKDVRLIILYSAVVNPNSDDEIVVDNDGKRWAISDVSSDPVKAGWTMRGTLRG